jgi:hypothetical protein
LTTYYYNVQIENDAGISYGTEGTFTTTSSVGDPTNFVAIPSATTITLKWNKGTGATNTMLRFSTSTYPNTTADGTLLYLGVLSSYTHTNLTQGMNYYYSIWGQSGGLYSANKATTLGTTMVGVATTYATPPTVTSSAWVSMPSELGLVNLPIYTYVNWIADSYSMPRATFWVFLYLALIVALGVFIYMKAPSNNLLLTGFSMGIMMIFGSLPSPALIPIWATFAYFIFFITVSIVANRY